MNVLSLLSLSSLVNQKKDILQEAEKREQENDKSDLAALNKAKEVTSAFIKSRDEKLFPDVLKQINLVKWNDVSELRNQVQDTKASIDKETAERQAKEKADAEERQRVETAKANGTPYFGSDGLLVETRSPNTERKFHFSCLFQVMQMVLVIMQAQDWMH